MIQTEATPNPDSLKFLSENVISAAGTEEFHESKKNEITNPFIKELLNFGGVELVLLSKNFLSVKKTKEASWEELKPMVISHLNDYFEKNKQPILKDKSRKLRAMQRSPNLDPKNHPWRQKYTWLFIDPLFTFALTIAQAEKPAQGRVGRKTIL